MRRRTLVAVAAGVLLPASPVLRAQAQPAPHRIAYLSAFARADVDVVLRLIRAELEKLGWTDGRNIVLLEPSTSESRMNSCRDAFDMWPVRVKKSIAARHSSNPPRARGTG